MFRLVTVALFVAGISACATHALTSGRVVLQNDSTQVAVSFNERDRALIHDYYAKSQRRLPPGLAKRRGHLPPGLAKRETLPPGLRRDPLPAALERQLSPLPSGYVRVRVNHDVVLLDSRTRVVVDVVSGVAI